jgi:hypothetical protein
MPILNSEYNTRELQLIGFNTDRAAAQLGVSPSWGAAAQDKEKWRKLAARLPLAPEETKPISEQARTEYAPGPAATTYLVVTIAAQAVS